jgi:DNA-binding response OmpR family regulator
LGPFTEHLSREPRFTRADPATQRLVRGPLEFRPDECQVLLDGERVPLTMREFEVLYVLAWNEDRVLRRSEIYGRVWGGEMRHRDRSVDVFVRKVRNKLALRAPALVFIHTHFGIGYRFLPALAAAADDPEAATDLIAQSPLAASRFGAS